MMILTTDKQIQSINKAGRYSVGITGLHLRVISKTKKYWVLRYALRKKRHDLTLGKYPNTSLAQARKNAIETQESIKNGLVSKETKKEGVDHLIGGEEKPLFKDFAIWCINEKKFEWRNSKHADQWIYTLQTYAFPVIGNKYLDQITTKDVLHILEPIWKTKTHTAMRLRGRLEWIFGSATTRGLRDGINPAQWQGHLITTLPSPNKIAKTKHHKALGYKDLFCFIKQLRKKDCVSSLALEFTILTAARTGETIKGKRSEIIDNVWTIPGERMKAAKEHRVPLVQRALDIIEIAKNLDPSSEYIFSNHGRPLSCNAMLQLAKNINPNITVHGFRSTFRTWSEEETLYPDSLAKSSLAHTIKDKVDAAYNRGDLFKKRLNLMCEWEKFCEGDYLNNVIDMKAN